MVEVDNGSFISKLCYEDANKRKISKAAKIRTKIVSYHGWWTTESTDNYPFAWNSLYNENKLLNNHVYVSCKMELLISVCEYKSYIMMFSSYCSWISI